MFVRKHNIYYWIKLYILRCHRSCYCSKIYSNHCNSKLWGANGMGITINFHEICRKTKQRDVTNIAFVCLLLTPKPLQDDIRMDFIWKCTLLQFPWLTKQMLSVVPWEPYYMVGTCQRGMQHTTPKVTAFKPKPVPFRSLLFSLKNTIQMAWLLCQGSNNPA